MATIRKNLVGVIHVDGHVLRAGDTIPAGITLGEHVKDKDETSAATAGTKKAATPKKTRASAKG